MDNISLRLTNLATLSIQNKIAENIDFDALIREFADRKARKVKFYEKKFNLNKWLFFKLFFPLFFFHMCELESREGAP